MKDKQEERANWLDATSAHQRILRSQISRIKETINRMLEIDEGLGEKIKTLFRDQGVTILTAISTIVASIVARVRPIPTPTPPTPLSGGGRKRLDLQKTLKNLLNLPGTKETRIKCLGRITGYHRWSNQLDIY